jgi:aryl-alcohol dehydrogenase-like predicted oxidoreductase
MRYRQLGDSPLQVSEVSLGSWLTYSGGVGREQTQACTRAAFEAGINFYDTANVYGRGAAEEAWGEILADHDRDSYVLATKVYFPMSDADRGLSAAQIHKQIDASLKRLRTDFVDLYQCHRYDTETPLEETVQALSEVVRAGKARYWGVSEWTAEQIEAAVTLAKERGLEKPVSSQPQYSMLWRRIEANGVLRTSQDNGISQIVW